VIGGGRVADEKVSNLLDYGADVVVISPTVTERLAKLSEDGQLNWIKRNYKKGDLKEAFIAIVADTKSDKINRTVSKEATARNVPLNVADVTQYCTWIAPAVVRQGTVVLAASTGGASPALARKLKELMSSPNIAHTSHGLMDYANLAPMLSMARKELANQKIRLIPDHWQSCLTDKLIDLVKDGKTEEAWNALMTCLLKGAECGCENLTCKMLCDTDSLISTEIPDSSSPTG